MAITHNFVSAKPAAADPTQVGSAEWNDDHAVTFGTGAGDIAEGNHLHVGVYGDISGTGVIGQVAEFVTDTKTLQAAKLIGPAVNILTLTNAAASTLALNITAAKTLTLTAADDYTLTVPATGTAALLATAQTFTASQKINVNSTTALFVEQDGVNDNTLVVDTANGRVGINRVPTYGLDIIGQIRWANQNTDSVNKQSIICTEQYLSGTETEGFIAFMTFCNIGNNQVYYGGGSSAYNAATQQLFYTAANTTTRTGTIALRISSGQLVTVGTADGTGRFNVIGQSDIIQTIIKANATQTTSLTEWQNSSAAVLVKINGAGNLFLNVIKSGATQVAAGAAAGEVWKTASHATLPDNVLLIGV